MNGFSSLPPDELTCSRGEVHLWHVGLDLGERQIDRLRQTLSSEEQGRASAFVRLQLRNRYIAARGSLRQLLGAYLQIAPGQLQLAYAQFGKPYLRDQVGQDALTFNLGRSRGRALIGITVGRRIGIDLEAHDDELDIMQLAERYFAKAEYMALAKLSGVERRRAFFRCWTAKEAYLKARGIGLQHPLHRFTVSVAPSGPVKLVDDDEKPGEVCRWTMAAVDTGTDYSAALAVEGALVSLRTREIGQR